MIQSVPITHVLVVSVIMFFVGVMGFIIRQNLIAILLSIELMLNAVVLNFLVFNRYLFPHHLQGHFFGLFIIGVAAAEAALAIALILNVYRRFKHIDPDKLNEMKY